MMHVTLKDGIHNCAFALYFFGVLNKTCHRHFIHASVNFPTFNSTHKNLAQYEYFWDELYVTGITFTLMDFKKKKANIWDCVF